MSTPESIPVHVSLPLDSEIHPGDVVTLSQETETPLGEHRAVVIRLHHDAVMLMSLGGCQMQVNPDGIVLSPWDGCYELG